MKKQWLDGYYNNNKKKNKNKNNKNNNMKDVVFKLAFIMWKIKEIEWVTTC